MSGTKPLTLARSAITTLRSTQRRSRQTEAKGKFAEVHSEASAGKGVEFASDRPSTSDLARNLPSNLTYSSDKSTSSRHISSRPLIPSEVKRHAASANSQAANDDLVEDPPAPLTNQNLSLLYASTTPPPLSALSAFAHRLAVSTSNPHHSLASDLPLLERCMIHESFWKSLPPIPASSRAPATRRYTNFHDTPLSPSIYAHNTSLASIGNSILGALTCELLLSSFPNLPTRVAKAALTLYSGPKSLASVVSSWGIGPSRLDMRLVGAEEQKKLSRKENAYGHLVGGVGPARKIASALEGSGGMGLVRWNRKHTTPIHDAVLYEDALASVARAIIGGIHQVHGFAAARSFVHSHFLSRIIPSSPTTSTPPIGSADLIPLLKFTNPSLVLSNTLSTYSMAPLSHKLLKESGRLSSHPTFLSGVFSGELKLGEGFGSSLRMSEWRASEDALRRLYVGGRKAGGLPSAAWGEKGEQFNGLVAGETEVKQESRGKGLQVGGVGQERKLLEE